MLNLLHAGLSENVKYHSLLFSHSVLSAILPLHGPSEPLLSCQGRANIHPETDRWETESKHSDGTKGTGGGKKSTWRSCYCRCQYVNFLKVKHEFLKLSCALILIDIYTKPFPLSHILSCIILICKQIHLNFNKFPHHISCFEGVRLQSALIDLVHQWKQDHHWPDVM